MAYLYYKPSGKFTIAGVALGLAGGVSAGLVLAFVYAYLISYVPIADLNILSTVGYSVLLGVFVGFILKAGKVRSTVISVAVALVVALASLYFSWAIWMSIFLGKANIDVSALEAARQPGLLWASILRVNELGAWSFHGDIFTGVRLWGVWAAEALIILGGTIFMTLYTAASTPFCEACQSWCDETPMLMLVNDAEADELKGRMEARDFDYFKRLGPKPDAQHNWVTVGVCSCPACGHTNTLTVHRSRLKIDKKGRSEIKAKVVVNKLLLNKDELARLRQISHELSLMPKPSSPAT